MLTKCGEINARFWKMGGMSFRIKSHHLRVLFVSTAFESGRGAAERRLTQAAHKAAKQRKSKEVTGF